MTERHTELMRLAERCEAAREPSRRLDYDIFCACVPMGERAYWEPDNRENHFTASLDAAMTLVPEGCLHMARTLWDDGKTCGQAMVSQYSDTPKGKFWAVDHAGLGATPALALCAATLKALAAQEDTNHVG